MKVVIKIKLKIDPIEKKDNLSQLRAIVVIIIYFFVMSFGAAFIIPFIKDNPKFTQEYNETDALIQTLHTKNGVALITKEDLESSFYDVANIEIYSLVEPEDEENEENNNEAIINLNDSSNELLENYILITSKGVFLSRQTEVIDKKFITNIFASETFYNNNFRVYRYTLETRDDDYDELFNYYEIENPVYDEVIKSFKTFNQFGNTFVNIILYGILIIGLIIIMFNVIKADFMNASSFKDIMSAALIGFLILYAFSFAANFMNIIISALVKERVIESANQAAILESLSSKHAWIMIITVVFLGPIVEELIFRKALFSLFNNKITAIIVSSLLFGFIHLTNETSVAGALVSLPLYLVPGIAFGYIYYKNDENILVPTAVHILSNLISVVIAFML